MAQETKGQQGSAAKATGAPTNEIKTTPTAKKGYTPLPGGCFSQGCKTPSHRFNFCDEHYEQFKFGLICKTGEPVPDYEKKIEHYTAYKTRKGVQKVA